MKTKWRVGNVMRLVRRKLDVDPVATYREIGVRSFGKGIFHKEPVLGAELGNKRVFAIQSGDLVLNNVFAWEGAVAVASQAEAGMCGSHRFLTYVANPEIATASYLRLFFLSEPGLALVAKASPGSAGRNRTLNISLLESSSITLPMLGDQKRRAAALLTVSNCVEKARDLTSTAEEVQAAVTEGVQRLTIERGIREGWSLVPLGTVAEVNPRPILVRPDEDPRVPFIPMRAVDDISGHILSPEERRLSEVASGYRQFLARDVIFARITPCMQNGKAAVVPSFSGGFAYGSTEFHVLRASTRVLPEWIHLVVRTRAFRDAAASHFTGTAGQQRVPAAFLETVLVPLPPTCEEQCRAIERCKVVEERAIRTRALHSLRCTYLDALMTSTLNLAFTTGDS